MNDYRHFRDTIISAVIMVVICWDYDHVHQHEHMASIDIMIINDSIMNIVMIII